MNRMGIGGIEKRVARKWLIGMVMILTVGWMPLLVTAQEAPAPSDEDWDVEVQLESFDKVWETIRRVHWDDALVGESWDEAREKYRPQIEKAVSIGEVRGILEKLIGELGQSHYGIIPVDAYDVVKQDEGEGYVGFDARLVGDEVLVTRVVAGSPADKAGVQPGWRVEQIGDQAAGKLIEKAEKAAHGPMRKETVLGFSVGGLSSGAPGSTGKFVFRDPAGETREVELERVVPPGKKAKFGNLPAMRVETETRTLDGGVGYFRFSSFFDPVTVMPAYNDAVQSEKHQNGLVIDLRGNPGGIGAMTMGMARPFVKEDRKLGVMYMKGAELKFNVVATPNPYQGPVALLVDECSASSSEVFSGGLQDLGVVRVFGHRTAGLALPSTVEKLPNGDGFQYAMASYISEDGKPLEMEGVVPDEPVELTQEKLASQGDPVLQAAVEWIRQQNESEDKR